MKWQIASTAAEWIRQHGALARQAAGHDTPSIMRWAAKASAWSRKSGRKPLVLYSQVAWDDVWQRPQEMARGLAAHRPTLFISPVQVHQIAGPLRERWKPVRTEHGGKLLIYSPVILTGEYKFSPTRTANRAILTQALKHLKKLRQFHFLTNSPFAGELLEAFPKATVSYDVIDDFCAFEWSPPEGRLQEKKVIDRAAFGIAGTWSMHEKFKFFLPEMEYFPSGVNVEKLQKPAQEPEDLKDLPHPRLLYVGTLNDRTSGKLIDSVARKFSKASIILVGPWRRTFHAPSFPSNVIALGLKPHDELPGYYQHCDLGLMPFADNEAARAINPVKTLEYLACGLPVISTPIPDVKRFYSDVVRVENPERWNQAIQELLDQDSDDLRVQRKEFANGRSWNNLVQRVEEKLRRHDNGDEENTR